MTVALLAMLRLLNESSVPALVMTEPLFMVMVPEVGERVAVELLVRVPATEKLVLAVTVAAEAVVKLKKVSVPELEIAEPLFMVMVPAEGVKVPVTVNVPLTIAVWVPEALIVPLILSAG